MYLKVLYQMSILQRADKERPQLDLNNNHNYIKWFIILLILIHFQFLKPTKDIPTFMIAMFLIWALKNKNHPFMVISWVFTMKKQVMLYLYNIVSFQNKKKNHFFYVMSCSRLSGQKFWLLRDQSVQKRSHKLTVRIKSISPHKPIQRSRSHLHALIILL